MRGKTRVPVLGELGAGNGGLVSPGYRWRTVSGGETSDMGTDPTAGKERGCLSSGKIGHDDTGGITVFGKKTEGTGAVEG
jgi:hypothetical protein